jgi:hypothetical protein
MNTNAPKNAAIILHTTSSQIKPLSSALPQMNNSIKVSENLALLSVLCLVEALDSLFLSFF